MHIVTGGAGFIGSAFAAKLNTLGVDDIIIVDEQESPARKTNLSRIKYAEFVDKHEFLRLVSGGTLHRAFPGKIHSLIHMGACSSTTERNWTYLLENNYGYTVRLAEYCLEHDIRFIYASSGATYGAGERGFSDSEDLLPRLKPINLYGQSKHNFDVWALSNGHTDKIVGLKFFNVYGPNEYHKGDQRSVVHRAYGQVKETGEVRLFKSYNPSYADGEQKRDFIYVRDCVDAIWWFINNQSANGIFNLGFGRARTWKDLALAVFSALGVEPQIHFIDMPESLRGQYQYFTEAPMNKLISMGYPGSFTSLEEGVRDYVQNFLEQGEQTLP